MADNVAIRPGSNLERQVKAAQANLASWPKWRQFAARMAVDGRMVRLWPDDEAASMTDNDNLRSLTADEVRELVEWMEDELRGVIESMPDAGDDYYRKLTGKEAALEEAIARLRAILARPVLVWRDSSFVGGREHGNGVALGWSSPDVYLFEAFHHGDRYEAVRISETGWNACVNRRVIAAGVSLDAAKAACEAHARGQG